MTRICASAAFFGLGSLLVVIGILELKEFFAPAWRTGYRISDPSPVGGGIAFLVGVGFFAAGILLAFPVEDN